MCVLHGGLIGVPAKCSCSGHVVRVCPHKVNIAGGKPTYILDFHRDTALVSYYCSFPPTVNVRILDVFQLFSKLVDK